MCLLLACTGLISISDETAERRPPFFMSGGLSRLALRNSLLRCLLFLRSPPGFPKSLCRFVRTRRPLTGTISSSLINSRVARIDSPQPHRFLRQLQAFLENFQQLLTAPPRSVPTLDLLLTQHSFDYANRRDSLWLNIASKTSSSDPNRGVQGERLKSKSRS